MELITENVYSHGRGKFWKQTSARISMLDTDHDLTVSYCNINIFLLLDELPQKIVPCFIIE